MSSPVQCPGGKNTRMSVKSKQKKKNWVKYSFMLGTWPIQVRRERRGGNRRRVRDGGARRGDGVEPLQDPEGRHAVVLHAREHGQERHQEQELTSTKNCSLCVQSFTVLSCRHIVVRCALPEDHVPTMTCNYRVYTT